MNIPHKANDTKIFTETLETANFAIVGHSGGVVRTSERTIYGVRSIIIKVGLSDIN